MCGSGGGGGSSTKSFNPLQEVTDTVVEYTEEYIGDQGILGEVPLVGDASADLVGGTLNIINESLGELPGGEYIQAAYTPVMAQGALVAGNSVLGRQDPLENSGIPGSDLVPTDGPFDPDSEEASLEAMQARFNEDERIRRFRGFGDTILTGGLGITSPSPVSRPTLIGT